MEPQIDAVAMTRRIRDAHAEQLRDATSEERIQFFREKARRLHAEIAEKLSVVVPNSAGSNNRP